MAVLARIGVDAWLAVAVFVWFLISGIVKLRTRPDAGRRAVAVPRWLSISGWIRGGLEVLAALAILSGAALSLLKFRGTFPGLAIGLGLAALAAWNVVDAVRTPRRWLNLALSVLGFALAVFYAGFRG